MRRLHISSATAPRPVLSLDTNPWRHRHCRTRLARFSATEILHTRLAAVAAAPTPASPQPPGQTASSPARLLPPPSLATHSPRLAQLKHPATVTVRDQVRALLNKGAERQDPKEQGKQGKPGKAKAGKAKMASFMNNLWTSIFTPGPTPTLLVATNATFALLQLVLFALLVATYSLHFVVLSGLCAGLWVGINWFAREVLAAQEEEEAQARRKEGKEGMGAGKTEDEGAGGGASTGAEAVGRASASRTRRGGGARLDVGGQPGQHDGASTDSEWEKVEGEQ